MYKIVYAAIIICLYACKTNKLNNNKGFVPIFDGSTLNGWAGDSAYWRIENGAITGEVRPETILKTNSFLVWQKETPANFELTLEYNITEMGNSGVNYRSEVFADVPNALRGYQCDIDGRNRYTGQNYEERGRTTLAYVGQKTTIINQSQPLSATNFKAKIIRNAWTDVKITDSLGNKETLLPTVKPLQWNTIHIIAKDNKLTHYVNNVLISQVTDNDTYNRKANGLIGVQVHVGPPMKVQFRNIMLKKL
jgi:hypothetical protein